MKKNEQASISVLKILIIAIVIFVVSKNANKGNNANENGSTTQQENTEPEEFVQVLEDGTKLNTSTELNKEKQVGNYKFENMQLTTQDNQTVLLADVTNTGSSKTDIQLVDVTLLDKDGNEIITVGGIISQLEPGEKTQFNTYMPSSDYEKMYNSNDTVTLTLRGIVRIKDDVGMSMINEGIAYSDDLTELVIEKAKEVLAAEFPELKFELEMPDEKNRRVGQSIAAASLAASRK